jgi:DNA-binding protein H-NS
MLFTFTLNIPAMHSYTELLHQIQELQQQADEIKVHERTDVIQEIREKIAMFNLKHEDLFNEAGKARSKFAGKRVPTQYRDNEGNTWSGRGKQPIWLVRKLMRGASMSDFLIR